MSRNGRVNAHATAKRILIKPIFEVTEAEGFTVGDIFLQGN